MNKLTRETRKTRYQNLLKTSVTIPLWITADSFIHEENLAVLIRACAFFGLKGMFLIGKLPPRSILKPYSGSTLDFVTIKEFKNPAEFIAFSRDNTMDLVSMELTKYSIPLENYIYNQEKDTVIVLGNETVGVSQEILHHSKHINIPCSGFGFCLNVAQAGLLGMYDFWRKSQSDAEKQRAF